MNLHIAAMRAARIAIGPLSSIIFLGLSSSALWCYEPWDCDLLIGLIMYLSQQSF